MEFKDGGLLVVCLLLFKFDLLLSDALILPINNIVIAYLSVCDDSFMHV